MEDFTVKLDISMEHMQNLFGSNDSHIRKIEDDLNVVIVDRDGVVKITGEKSKVQRAVRLVNDLVALSERGNILDEQNVGYALEMDAQDQDNALLEMDKDCICHTINGKPIKP